jgi:hypothetical protein
LYSVALPVRVVVVEEHSNILVGLWGNVLQKEVANDIAVLGSPSRIRIGAESMDENDTMNWLVLWRNDGMHRLTRFRERGHLRLH